MRTVRIFVSDRIDASLTLTPASNAHELQVSLRGEQVKFGSGEEPRDELKKRPKVDLRLSSTVVGTRYAPSQRVSTGNCGRRPERAFCRENRTCSLASFCGISPRS